jgi:hypothetical protein
MEIFLIICSLLVILFIGYRYFKKGADKITDFFWNAWKAYVFFGDEEAREAASLALATAGSTQRKSMVFAFEDLKGKVFKSEDFKNSDSKVVADRFSNLSNDFSALVSSSISISTLGQLKQDFNKSYPECFKALSLFDSKYFLRKYPDLDKLG